MAARMATSGSRVDRLNAALDQAISALTSLDAAALEGIEGSVSALLEGVKSHTFFAVADTERATQLQEVAARHRLLGTLLASTNLNLSVLERLHSRNAIGDTSWVR